MNSIEKLMHATYISEMASVAQTIINISLENDWSQDAYLSSTLASLESKETELTIAIKKNKVISELETLDKDRNNKTRAVFYLNKGYLHHTTPAVATASALVEKQLKKYGLKIVHENYAQETAHIESLLEDFKGTELLAAITLLPSMPDLIAQLTTAQAHFVTNYAKYEENKANEALHDNATTIKSEILELINNALTVYLQAMQLSNPDKYSVFTTAVAQVIKDNNVKVKKRRKKSEE